MVGVFKLTVFHYDIGAVPGLATEGHAGICFAKSTAVDDHIGNRSVAGNSVDISAFAAFETYTVVIDVHVALADQDVVADIHVNRIGAGAFWITVGRSKDGHAEIFHTFAVVKVVGPETGVDHAHTAYGHIFGVGNIDHTRTKSLQVGTLFVDLAAKPEFIIETMAVAVDSAFATDGKAIAVVGIDKSSKIIESLAFETGLDDLIVGYSIAALQFAAFEKMQMGRRLEKERATEESAFRDHNHTSTILSCEINDSLNTFGLDDGAVIDHTMFGHHILLSERVERRLMRVVKPRRHRASVRKLLEFGLGRKSGSE